MALDDASLARLATARQIVEEVAAELNTATAACSECHLNVAEDYDELQLWRSLDSTANRLEQAEAKARHIVDTRTERDP